MPRLVDLSHALDEGTLTYPGLPAPSITQYLTREESRRIYADGTEFQIARIEMVANSGTYLDAPFHRYAEGRDMAELPLESVADLEAVVVEASGRATGSVAFENIEVDGKAVLIRTGWDRHWGTRAYFDGHPFLTADGAQALAGRGAALVGIDSLNIDDTEDLTRPVHSILLGAGIPICEHLCRLGELPAAGFRFFAVPVKVRRMGSFPVRAFALV